MNELINISHNLIAGYVQVLFLAGTIGQRIQMRCQGVPLHNTSHPNNMLVSGFPICPEWPQKDGDITVLYVHNNSKVPTHIVPLITSHNQGKPPHKIKRNEFLDVSSLLSKNCAANLFGRCQDKGGFIRCNMCGCFYHKGCVGVRGTQYEFMCCNGEPTLPMSNIPS